MDPLCDQVEAFADGGLDPEAARAFTAHLATCARCQARLTGLMQLEELGRQYVERHGPVKVPWYAGRLARWAGSGLGIAVAAALVVALALRSSFGEAGVWKQAERSEEVRVTYGPADAHRSPPQRTAGTGSEAPAPARTPALLARLENRGDLKQLVALYLVDGRPDPANARSVLKRPEAQRLWDAADLWCDLAAVDYAEQKYADALKKLNLALRLKPGHVQALWNRALVYRELGFPLLARQDFAEVERRDPDDEWKKEAIGQQRELSNILDRKERWKLAGHAGDALVRGAAGAVGEAVKLADVPLMRRDFYDAVRVRTSAADVLALLPLARQLDGNAGAGNVLTEYVQRIASGDFTRRAPLAKRYAQLLAGKLTEDKAKDDLLRQSLALGEEDLALGALVLRDDRDQRSPELERLARSNPDPWFTLVSLQVQADAASQVDEHERARDLLEGALDVCRRKKLTYRCLDIENDLAFELTALFQLDEGVKEATEGLKGAKASAEWDKVAVFLRALGNVSRRRADATLGRAFYSEALLATDAGDRPAEQDIRQNLAHLAILDLDLAEARRQLEQVMNAGPLTIHGAEALVDISRAQKIPRAAQALEQALAANPGKTAGQRAYATFLRGRFSLVEDAGKGRKLLESAIAEAEAAGEGDPMAKHARAYSYASLIFDDAGRGDFESALRRFGAELGLSVPPRCVLALAEETERSLILARGADGKLLDDYQAQRTERLPIHDLDGIVPGKMVSALEPCDQVDVLVRPPLQGRPGALPDQIAWRYRSLPAPRRPPEGKGLYLVVQEVSYDRKDKKPLRWTPSFGPATEIKGLDATPGRVSEAMQSATEIDLATHGETGPDSKLSRLLLARDVKGGEELRDGDIRALKLMGAPLVILAACQTAQAAPELHELAGLPYAFLAAGAREVIAPTVDIPDQESSDFFGAVRALIRSGATPAVAVRKVRLEWLDQKKGINWIHNVVVFG